MTTVPLFHVYILQNPAGTFYIGHTQDLAARLASHNDTGPILGKFTRKNGPWSLVHQEPFATRSQAMRREREIKAWKSAQKIRDLLTQRQSPAQRD